MNFEDLQLAWQQEAKAAPKPVIDEALVRSVRVNSRKFQRRIFWRDLREVAASFLVAFVFGRIAWEAQVAGTPAWPAWIATVLPLGVAAFFLIDRWRAARRNAPQGEAVLAEIDRAADAVKHQIWLLRNVFWWYILPIAISVLFVAIQMFLYLPTTLPPAVAFWIKLFVGLLVVGPAWAFDWWVWKINQRAIRVNLEPELAELEARRREITGEPGCDDDQKLNKDKL